MSAETCTSHEATSLGASLRHITKHSFTYGLGRLIGNIVSFFLIPLYTRFLSTADYGILSSMTATDSVLMVLFTLGLQSAVFRFYFEHKEMDRKAMIGSLWVAQASISLILCSGFFFFSRQVAIGIFGDVSLAPYLRLVALRVFFDIGALIPLNLFRAQEKPVRYILFTLLAGILGTCLNIYFVVVLKKGALGVLYSGVITATLFYIPYLRVIFKEGIFRFRKVFLIQGLLFSLPLLPHDLSNWVLNLSDRILLQRLSSAAELGLYALGYNLTLLLSVITLAINNAWAPFFLSTAEKEDGPKVISRLLTYYFCFICFIALSLSILSKEITTIMAAESYRRAYLVMPLLAFGYVFQGMYYMSVNCIFLKKKTKYLPLTTAVAALLNIGLNLLWIPHYGMLGAAWATLIAFGVKYALTTAIACRLYPLRYEKSGMIKIIGAAGAIAILDFGVRFDSFIVGLGYKLILLLGYIVILVFLRFFTREDIYKIKKLFVRPERAA